MTIPDPASRRTARAGGKPPAVPKPRTALAAGEPPALDDLWRAYELAQQHYEIDLQLFSVRMNLFLIIQSALVALAGGAAHIGGLRLVVDRSTVAAFGLALAAAWLVVASSSYLWVKTWRAQMIELGDILSHDAHVELPSRLFDHRRRKHAHQSAYGAKHPLWKQLEIFSWIVRPTLVSCCLPVLFMAGWVYLGWF